MLFYFTIIFHQLVVSTFCRALSLFSIMNEKEKRSFPNFQSLLFDFTQNALSRLSFRKFFSYLIFLRFFFLGPKFSDFLNFKETILNNEFSFSQNNLYDYMFKRCSTIQEKTERYAIYLATQPNASKVALESGFIMRKTHINLAQMMKDIRFIFHYPLERKPSSFLMKL